MKFVALPPFSISKANDFFVILNLFIFKIRLVLFRSKNKYQVVFLHILLFSVDAYARCLGRLFAYFLFLANL